MAAEAIKKLRALYRERIAPHVHHLW